MCESAANAAVTSWWNARAKGLWEYTERELERVCPQFSQTSGRYQGICQLADPYNYPAITTQLAASESINAAETSYGAVLARVCCDRSSFRCHTNWIVNVSEDNELVC